MHTVARDRSHFAITGRGCIVGLLAVVCLLETMPVACGESSVAVTLREPWANVFGGREAVFHVAAESAEPFNGRLVWAFDADGRTLARGEFAVKAVAGTPAACEVRLAVPSVNPGVVMKARLSVQAVPSGSAKEAGGVDRVMWVFPEDPFFGHSEWLKKLEIRLFDPVGATARLLDGFKVPYTLIRNVDGLEAGAFGLLVVGEGVSFKDYRGLFEVLVKVARTGKPVLCLAPGGGEMRLPGSVDAELPLPSSLAFRRHDFIGELDKRLDAVGWKSGEKAGGCGLKIRGDRGPVSVEVGEVTEGWSVLDVGFGKGEGRLIVCGFGLIGAWAESPTPRFLFVRMLEHVAGGSGTK